MGRHNAVRVFTANRQAAAFQMSDAFVQHLTGGAVINGQLHTDAVDLQIADHEAVEQAQRKIGEYIYRSDIAINAAIGFIMVFIIFFRMKC